MPNGKTRRKSRTVNRQRPPSRTAIRKKTSGTHTKAKSYVAGIRWDEWWADFIGTRDPDGSLTYKTAWQFAKKKGSGAREQKIIYMCIGPRPVYYNRKGEKTDKGPVPWLGDWQIQRTQMNYFDDERIDALQKGLVDRLDAMAAGRGAAVITLEWVSKFEKWSQKIDEAYGGGIPVRGPSEKEKAYAQRIKRYFGLQDLVFRKQMQALTQFLRCHGISDDNISILANMTVASFQGNVGMPGALPGQGEQLTGDQKAQLILHNATAGILMDSWHAKSRLFKMPLHDPDAEKEIAALDVKGRVVKNGKRKNGGKNGKG